MAKALFDSQELSGLSGRIQQLRCLFDVVQGELEGQLRVLVLCDIGRDLADLARDEIEALHASARSEVRHG